MTAEVGKDLFRARTLLEHGELVAIPTETVYGLAANALDANAVQKIFTAKGRPYYDPLIVHLRGREVLEEYVERVPAWAEKLSDKFWPGPLTLVLRKRTIIPDIVTAGHETVGLRVPGHPFTLELLKSLSFPLAAPSANPFGYISPTRPAHVLDQLGERISYVLDGGECKVGIESTIVGEENGLPVVLRLGGVSLEALRGIVGNVEVKIRGDQEEVTPGSLDSHYAPQHPLLFDSEYQPRPGERIGYLGFKSCRTDIPTGMQMILSPDGDLDEAAEKLFAALRALDRMPIDLILAERFPEEGLGRAINDRLERASYKKQLE